MKSNIINLNILKEKAQPGAPAVTACARTLRFTSPSVENNFHPKRKKYIDRKARLCHERCVLPWSWAQRLTCNNVIDVSDKPATWGARGRCCTHACARVTLGSIFFFFFCSFWHGSSPPCQVSVWRQKKRPLSEPVIREPSTSFKKRWLN